MREHRDTFRNSGLKAGSRRPTLVIGVPFPYLIINMGSSSTKGQMESEKKRRKYSSSSNDSDATDIHVTSWSRCSKNMNTNSTWARQEDKPKKPSEVFRTDFITAMKLPDSSQLSPDEFYILTDPWRQEWEKGVQVPAMVEAIPEPVVSSEGRVAYFSLLHFSSALTGDDRGSVVARPKRQVVCAILSSTSVEEQSDCSMPSCVIAFHVTCAFNHSLEMRTILAENDEVRFKSYCLDHSSNLHSGAGTSKGEQPPGDGTTEPRVLQQQQQEKIDKMELEKASQRKQKLQELEDEFYRLVNPADVSESLGLPDAHVDFLYQFWKLKRKSNFNQPLLTPKQDEVDNLAQQEQDVLYKRLKLFTHLRQDLERVRNLCYMVTRREKMKHSLCHLQEKVFHLQIQLIEEDLAREKAGKGGKAAKGRQSEVRGRRKCSPEKNERWKPENGSLLKQLGLSKTFPIDEALFNSWLAQSVQITTEDMLSQWSLHDRHEEKTASLLSDQLLQGEESLLSLMMDHSMREPRGSPGGRVARPPPPPPPGTTKVATLRKQGPRKRGPQKELQTTLRDPNPPRHRKGSPQPPVSKMDSCHISEERSHWVDRKEPAQEPKYPVKVPEAVSAPKTVVRFRLPKQGKSKSKACSQDQGNGTEHIEKDSFDNETDGYYSDAEMSDSDTQSSNGRMRLGQLHSGTEDLVRRSVLAS
ncbi:JADE2 ligase, partial [Polyodon spathula]|nr:JADE2 ligase [Polyodon spathula]